MLVDPLGLPAPRLLTRAQAATELHCTPRHIGNLVDDRELIPARVENDGWHRQWFYADEVQQLALRRSGKQPRPIAHPRTDQAMGKFAREDPLSALAVIHTAAIAQVEQLIQALHDRYPAEAQAEMAVEQEADALKRWWETGDRTYHVQSALRHLQDMRKALQHGLEWRRFGYWEHDYVHAAEAIAELHRPLTASQQVKRLAKRLAKGTATTDDRRNFHDALAPFLAEAFGLDRQAAKKFRTLMGDDPR